MWLLHASRLQLESFEGENIPEYAILSHRWQDDEVLFKDIRKSRFENKRGAAKVRACCKQALQDGINYVWIDTCCIDKSSSAELSEAINSMFQLYKQANVCYAYLVDISMDSSNHEWASQVVSSVWFERGWTLQELIAPTILIFFDSKWRNLGEREHYAQAIQDRTDIPPEALGFFKSDDYCIAQKLSWARGRKTTRVEDRAYSLLGLFDLNMPLLYGEGKKAFLRLQYELMRESNDTSIFLSSGQIDATFGMLATSPDSFQPLKVTPSVGSFRHNFMLSKEGISGCFRLYHHEMDIYALMLDSNHEPSRTAFRFYIFLQWDFTYQQFQRVIYDEQHFEVRIGKLVNNNFAGQHDLVIGRLPRVKVDVDWIRKERIKHYLGWPRYAAGFTSSLFCVAGHFCRSDKDSANVEPLEPLNATYANFEIVNGMSILRSPTNFTKSLKGQCLCLGSAGQQMSRNSTTDNLPTLVLHHGFNLENNLVTFLSWLPAGPLRTPNTNFGQGQSCHLSGFCWFDDPSLTATAIIHSAEEFGHYSGSSTFLSETKAIHISRIADWIEIHKLQQSGGFDVAVTSISPHSSENLGSIDGMILGRWNVADHNV